MKRIRVISYAACEPPGYLCDYLRRRGLAYENIRGEQGQDISADMEHVAGLVFLGAPVSVYDSVPWISDEIALIRRAFNHDIPVLGICFGAQLMAQALDAEVRAAPGMQIGWYPVSPTEEAKSIFAEASLPDHFEVFEWHGDTFDCPALATPLFVGECIRQQGFLYRNSLALQFHPEITATLIDEWLNRYAPCFNKPVGCMQDSALMRAHLDERLAAQRAVADALFAWWLGGLNWQER